MLSNFSTPQLTTLQRGPQLSATCASGLEIYRTSHTHSFEERGHKYNSFPFKFHPESTSYKLQVNCCNYLQGSLVFSKQAHGVILSFVPLLLTKCFIILKRSKQSHQPIPLLHTDKPQRQDVLGSLSAWSSTNSSCHHILSILNIFLRLTTNFQEEPKVLLTVFKKSNLKLTSIQLLYVCLE